MFTDAEIIHSYTRRQAIADGVLVEVEPLIAGEAGFKCSLALTSAVYVGCVEWPENEAGQDELGRLWDVVWMARCAGASVPNSNRTAFQILRVPRGGERAETVSLVLHIGPGDEGEAVAIIMETGED
jgi:hypothetical protein